MLTDVWAHIHAILWRAKHSLTVDEIFDRQRLASCTSLHRIELTLAEAYDREWVYRGIRSPTNDWTYALTDAGQASIAAGEPPVPQTPPHAGRLTVGDRVRKKSGYRFVGEVRAVFTKKDGAVRIVVENQDELLHIFNEDQMEKI